MRAKKFQRSQNELTTSQQDHFKIFKVVCMDVPFPTGATVDTLLYSFV